MTPSVVHTVESDGYKITAETDEHTVTVTVVAPDGTVAVKSKPLFLEPKRSWLDRLLNR